MTANVGEVLGTFPWSVWDVLGLKMREMAMRSGTSRWLSTPWLLLLFLVGESGIMGHGNS